MNAMLEVIELTSETDLRTERGISLLPSEHLRRDAPDRSLVALRDGSVVGRCSCWWRTTAMLDDARAGYIGHYASADADAGSALLSAATDLLKRQGCAVAVGPLDGSTWRNYRFVAERGSEPPFFLEPDHPDCWLEHWSIAGFSPCASYSSAITGELSAADSLSPKILSRLTDARVEIRPFDMARPDAELRRLYGLACVSFKNNLLFSPIAEEEFLERTGALLPYVHPDLILLAERDGQLAGFLVALPDMLQRTRGERVDTVIVKTTAVDPELSGHGIGGVLVDQVQRNAARLGYRRAIHALMHDGNTSRRISDRWARPFRRYTLLSKSIAS